MKAVITQSRFRHYKDRYIHAGFNVFVKSNATAVVDNWFNDNAIWNLDFKCKAWNKLKNAANKLNIAAIRDVVGVNCDVTYSVYTGCSMCPCSPGFRVRKCVDDTTKAYINCDVWMDIEVDVSTITAMLPECTEMMRKEIEFFGLELAATML